MRNICYNNWMPEQTPTSGETEDADPIEPLKETAHHAHAPRDARGEDRQKAQDHRAIAETKLALGLHVTPERAESILGKEHVLGPSAIAKALGIEVRDVPAVPYTEKQLREAKENGETLVLRISDTPDGRLLNLRTLVALKRERTGRLFPHGDIADENFDDTDFWAKGTDFIEREAPAFGWKLIDTRKVGGTEHLSFRAQEAFVAKDGARLAAEVADVPRYWRERWGDDFAGGREGGAFARTALASLPDAKTLTERMGRLPDGAALPTVTEAIYDHLLAFAHTGKPLITGRSIATSSTVPPGTADEADRRPWDVSASPEGGIIVHVRRSDRMGRPDALGDLEPGVPIAYVQH
jgi:hypothetical protein